ncbi:hypothetical protein LT708_25065 [Pseudomonas syringae pv. syringae]|uniref:hypothetical protein n=1 Tax=Pseudomonas syringae TaxID=317 RepID=UPI00200B7F0C|nr:hypothetical protein [Pseudomonas syringae]MCK9759865.1 hypothetical protein [Pseudomonas syringae pv. syringae]MCK9774856.1 hypothetical protein [Pseudomonas syringae pv. syringae]
MKNEKRVIGWEVEFEDGSVELWKASDINGEPSFGRFVTPMVAGGETIDLAPEQNAD